MFNVQSARIRLQPDIWQRYRNRVQATALFPFLDFFICPDGPTKYPESAQVLELVESGRPLIKGLTQIFQCPAWVFRRLKGCPTVSLSAYRHAPTQLIADLACFELKDARFDSGEAHCLYHLIHGECGSLSALRPAFWRETPACRVEGLLCISWAQHAEQVLSGMGISAYVQFIRELDLWVRLVLDQQLASPQSRDSTELDALMGQPTFFAWSSLASAWDEIEHQHWDEYLKTYIKAHFGGLRWPPIFSERIEIDGYQFVGLCSEDDLIAEGQAMNNCVLTIAHKCFTTEHNLLSVRSDAKHVATCSLRAKGQTIFTTEQFKGPNNSGVSTQLYKAKEELVDRQNRGQILINPEWIAYRERLPKLSVVRTLDSMKLGYHQGLRLFQMGCAMKSGKVESYRKALEWKPECSRLMDDVLLAQEKLVNQDDSGGQMWLARALLGWDTPCSMQATHKHENENESIETCGE
ncbi:MAG: PcfJ domain-containing protein [Stenotrophobium sp.]